MLRTWSLAACLSASWMLCASCSDDDQPVSDVGNAEQGVLAEQGTLPPDQGSPMEGGSSVDRGSPPADRGGPSPDRGGPSPDRGRLPDGIRSPDGIKVAANSGTICSVPQNQCPHPTDECIIVNGGVPNKGMCLVKCPTKGQDCAVADPSKQKSVCFLDFTGAPPATYCAYFCLYQSKSYTCPAGADCKNIGSGTSVCVQK